MAEIRIVFRIYVWRPLVKFRCKCKDRKYILKIVRINFIWQYFLQHLWAFRDCKSRRISWTAKQTLSSQEGCCCVELSVLFQVFPRFMLNTLNTGCKSDSFVTDIHQRLKRTTFFIRVKVKFTVEQATKAQRWVEVWLDGGGLSPPPPRPLYP